MISCKTDRDFSINNLHIIVLVEVDSLGSYTRRKVIPVLESEPMQPGTC